MVKVWRLFQGGEMCIGHLPDTGGVMDQPTVMLDAFSFMTNFEARLTEKDALPLDEDGAIDWVENERCLTISVTNTFEQKEG